MTGDSRCEGRGPNPRSAQITASRLREALAHSGLSDTEIKVGLTDLAATGGILVDEDSID